jgi:hypothetical protein
MHSATRWPAVAAALQRPNENTVGVLCTWHFGERSPSLEGHAMSLSLERARQHWSSLDCYSPREAPSWRPSILSLRPMGERLDGCVSPYQLSSHRDDEI